VDRPRPSRTPFAYTPPPTEAVDHAFTTGRLLPVGRLELEAIAAVLALAALALLTGGGRI
jgi:hypothetical protein